jgi:hypothetical protein
MGRISSNTVILERLPKLKVSQLMADFRPNTRGIGTIGIFEASVSFGETTGTVELRSKDGKRQKVELVSFPSNLGKGIRWYFVCPVTGKRATHLYLYQGIFVHRAGIDKAFYRKQTESQLKRMFRMLFDTLDQMEKETDPGRYERIKKRHERYIEKVANYIRPKVIETEYDLSKRRIISKTVNGQQRLCPKQ